MTAYQPAPETLFAKPCGDCEVSFEFFPPASEAMQAKLWSSIERLAPLGPRFVSVTYGAGGTTRERTHATVRRILEETELTPAAHLTCVDASRAEVDAIARDYWEMGVRHIVALRGDPPDGQFVPHADGYGSAAELVAGLKQVADFDISVAAYPELHPEAQSPETELDYLLRKIDAGASRAITQFFFSPDCFFRLRDAIADRGREVELVPGILPVTNVERTRSFAAKCGSSIPDWIDERFDGMDDDPHARELVASAIATELCGQLYAGGVRQFHFYTLNRASLSKAICRMLGIKG
ncbi:methylenetetrahydrofolate reductase [NAD(P)H] [Sphingomicrobium flavum]|uniref:methylenetetrahydrofolate reductase [NAD(P)H] n=1 Tax=Sphingomicrobium flavum TaxID=1229164 RepID=UPI0021AE19E5|nr:methylenetetrahydrofolate reductase [NAD(P)H] [Sphingomicrobium flavum]